MSCFKYAIALTGGIATGKSTIAKILSFNGFSIIDCDKIAHEVLDEHSKDIALLFGDEYLHDDKTHINRAKLSKLIFSSPNDKTNLEALLHPLIFDRVKKQADIYDKSCKKYILDIALFFESTNYEYKNIKEIIVAYTNKELQLQRLMQRDGFSKEEALKRINSQIDIEIKKQKATYVIDNCKDIKSTTKQTNDLSDLLLNSMER